VRRFALLLGRPLPARYLIICSKRDQTQRTVWSPVALISSIRCQ
jgi:hypothetical protein